MKELLRDILTSMQSNRQRIVLTGFAIGWGIFILIMLLGAGNGITRGVSKSYFKASDDVVTVIPGVTSLPWGGYNKGRTISFRLKDAETIMSEMNGAITQAFPEMMYVSRINAGSEYCQREIWGEMPGFFSTMDMHVVEGRNISVRDQEEERRVCIISKVTANSLFHRDSMVCGNRVSINGVSFTVIGVFASNRTYIINNSVYIPLSTIRSIFCHADELTQIRYKMRAMADTDENDEFNIRLRNVVSDIKDCSPKDTPAVKIMNTYDEYLSMKAIVDGLQWFVWFIGIATLISGIVGISNIMSITVKERTQELGVLRAMGARPKYIFSMILIEAVMIALIFGYIGLMCGIGFTQALSAVIEAGGESEDSIISDPTVGLGLVSIVTIIMVLSGIVAGYIPARKAIKIKLIDALMAI